MQQVKTRCGSTSMMSCSFSFGLCLKVTATVHLSEQHYTLALFVQKSGLFGHSQQYSNLLRCLFAVTLHQVLLYLEDVD